MAFRRRPRHEKAFDLDDADFHIDLTGSPRTDRRHGADQRRPDHLRMEPSGRGGRSTAQLVPILVRLSPTLIPIEDFDTTGFEPSPGPSTTHCSGRRSVRIAVMGDSFVEGDILSSDLRESCSSLTAVGAGFRSDGFAADRLPPHDQNPVKGWDSYNIMQRRRPRRELRDYYLRFRAGSASLRRSLRSLGRFTGPGLLDSLHARRGSCSSAPTTAVSS